MSIIDIIKSAAKKLPGVNKIISENETLHSELACMKQYQGFVPPGHYYSPIPSIEDIRKDASKIFGPLSLDIPGIDLREAEQFEILKNFIDFYNDMPFQPQKTEGLRYYFENQSYSYSDAIMLHCMIRYLKPNKIIEVGSGFSSCVTLDTNELFFNNGIATTFIEPYPELLLSLLKEKDKMSAKLISCRLQDADISEFETLGENDILFIDSTHVSKVNSDVNRIFFEILPRLKVGVHIHFHDIFYPFEYPKDWLMEGRAWNEAYMLRAFLQFNTSFEVVLMNTFMEFAHESYFREKMPLCMKNPGGSIWIRKISK